MIQLSDVTLNPIEMNVPRASQLPLFLLVHPQLPSESPPGCCGGKFHLQTSQLWDNWKTAHAVNTLWCLFTAVPHSYTHTHTCFLGQLAAVSSSYWMAATTGMNLTYIFRTWNAVGTLRDCLNPSRKLEHVNVFNSNLTEISKLAKSHKKRVCLSPWMRKIQ